MKTIFGPVPSRRLGRSLGIDVIPPKTCSYDCIYCESGRTTHLTIKRQAFVAPELVMHDLEDYFRDYPGGADVLTFSSAGEPTLYFPLGELLRMIKRRFPSLPLIVLTNGSLLGDPEVRRDLTSADRVVPSVDAVTPAVFKNVNRPHPALELSSLLEGLYAFRREYHGQLHLEVMLVSGCNDHPEELKRIRQVVDLVRPDQVELNTVVRPPAYDGVAGLSEEAMHVASGFFPCDISHIIGRFQAASCDRSSLYLEDRVLQMALRRPCTIPEMADSLGAPLEDLEEILNKLQKENRLIRYRFNDMEYVCIEPGSAG